MMNIKHIEDLLGQLRQIDSQEVSIGRRVGQDEIEAAQRLLGFEFCDDYKQFLEQYGNLWLCGEDLKGLIPGDGASTCSDLRYQTNNFKLITGVDPGARTVLVNENDEWYELIDHTDGKIYAYDPFANKFKKLFQNLEDAIINKIEEAIEIVKAS